MSYTELEHGYQGLRSASRPIFYVGDITTVQPTIIGPAASSTYRSSNRSELSDGCAEEDGCPGGATSLDGEGKQVLVGVCAMSKKSQSKPMKEILTRLEEFEYLKIVVFPEEVILKEPVEDWPIVDCLISFHSKGFPLDKAIQYASMRNPFIINNLPMQYDIQDRRRVYAILDGEGIEIPRYAVLDRDSADPKHHELVESEDHVEVNGVTFNKPFVEKPVSAEDHNIYIYYPTSAGGGSQRLFRKIGSRSSVYSPESRVRKTGSYIYEDFMPTDGTDVKVYTVGPDYAHAEARKSPALDGKVERDSEGKEIRYPVILSNAEKLISRKVCLAFKQTVCGFDLLRANGQSFVCDVNGFSFVKNSNKYYDDCAKIMGNMILRELAPTLHIPWSVPFQLDDPPIVPTTFGKMMELRCVVAVIRHGDRTPKQKMKVEVRHPKFFEIFAKYDGYKHGHVKLKRPKQLQEILDTARSLLTEIQHRAAGPELEEKQGKLEQLKSVLEMYGHFSGINRKVQMKYQPKGRPRGSSSDDDRLGEPSLVLILKWGGELTPAGRIQAEELGRIFRCMYPGGQGRHLSGEYAGAQGLGLLRLHSTFRHDLKIYASDEGRVQMTAAAFAKGLLALEGELTPILVQMVKSANTNGLLDNDCDSSKYQNMVKTRLHELLQQDKEFTREDREQINPGNALSINAALDFVKNPVKCCKHVHALIQKLMDIVRIKKDDPKTKDAILYHGETWELMGRRWGKIEKDFCTKHKRFDISKIPDIYDCIKYDLQHNNHTLQFDHAEELYMYAKYLADIVIPQEYGLTVQEKLTIGQGICTPLLKKIRADLQRNIEETGEETVNRLNPRYSHGVSSPGRHVRTRLYFTSESHVHSLLTVLRYGGLLDVVKDEQWRRAMEYVSMVSELNYMSQIVVMLYEDPTKDPSSEERFHVELHFSPGVNCCVQKNLPPGPGFRPHSRNESSHNLGEAGTGQDGASQCSTRIEEEDPELGILEDDISITPSRSKTSPPLMEIDDTDTQSPKPSRAIDMMDLDSNLIDEPYDSGFLQSSAPIPISARTVAGHEAARLGSQLAASQRQRREREAAGICEPRARSYDHQRQEKPEKPADKLQYQSLDAVNKEVHKLDKTRPKRHIAVELENPDFLCASTCPAHPPALAHSLSSPELPIPIPRNTSPPTANPLVTFHSTPLASPGTLCPPPQEIAPLRSSYDPPPEPAQTKRYGRSFSEMAISNVGVCGELNILPQTRSPSTSLRECSPLAVRSAEDLFETTVAMCSNGLSSPHPPGCWCYNCAVSELIATSKDLSPSERSNLKTYFVRSLSHKFNNCSCYNSLHVKECRHDPRTWCMDWTPSTGFSGDNVRGSSRCSCDNQSNRLRSVIGSPPNYCPEKGLHGTLRCSYGSRSCRSISPNPTLRDDRVSNLPWVRSPSEQTLYDTSRYSDGTQSCRSRSPNLASQDDSSSNLPWLGSPPSSTCSCCSGKTLFGSSKHSFDTQNCKSRSPKPVSQEDCSLHVRRLEFPPSTTCSCPSKQTHSNTLRCKLRSPKLTGYRPYIRINNNNSSCCYSIKPRFPQRIISNSQCALPRRSSCSDIVTHCTHIPISPCRSLVDHGTATCMSHSPKSSTYRAHFRPQTCSHSSHTHHKISPHRSMGFGSEMLSMKSLSSHPNLSNFRHSLSRRFSCSDIFTHSTRFTNRRSSDPQLPRFHSRNHITCHSLVDIELERALRNRHVCTNHTGSAKPQNHALPQRPRKPYPRLEPQRSFSFPDTRPTVIQPDPTCTARRHRHSISGQMSYFKLLGYNVGKKLTGSTNSLFSTAVISGSSSAPNLKDMVPPHASAIAAIEGFGGVPPIRPLETLHNALSLRQLDSFLEMMTGAPLFRTPASSPPKFPSPGGSTQVSVFQNLGIGREYHSSDAETVRYITPTLIQYKSVCESEPIGDLRNQLSPTSPNSAGWSSELPSFLSEPSSPAPTSTGECSMSTSLISNEGTQPFSTTPKFPASPTLALDFNEICMCVDQCTRESRGSISYTDYYSNEDGQIRKTFDNACRHLHKSDRSCSLSIDGVEEEEDHTLTLRQSEEQKKQDVKFVFEQKEDLNTEKPASSYKKIGRFRVESMDIPENDVRMKESSKDKVKSSLTQKLELWSSDKSSSCSTPKESCLDPQQSSGPPSTTCRPRRKNFFRSQSVSTPKAITPKADVDYSGSRCASSTRQNSFSTMSDEDLQNFKMSVTKPVNNPDESNQPQQEPVLTLAVSFKDSSSVKIGFDIEDEREG